MVVVLKFDLFKLCCGKWVMVLEEIVCNGLFVDDSVGQIVFEMVKWFWWVELFDLLEEECYS